MRPNIRVPLLLVYTAINHIASSHGWWQSKCDPYMEDIQAALRDFRRSTLVARHVIEPVDGRVIDWTGLLATLYPGLYDNDDLVETWGTVPGLFSPLLSSLSILRRG